MSGRRLIPTLVFAGVLMAFPACGKKGPPALPQRGFEARVVHLQGEWREGHVRLSGTVQAPAGAGAPVRGGRVEFGGYPLADPPCEGCPVAFEGFQEFGPDAIQGTTLSWRAPEKSHGRILFFRVRLLGPGGAMGLVSETVRVVVP